MEGGEKITASYRILKQVSNPNFHISKTLYFGGTDHHAHAHKNARFVLVTEGCFEESYAGKQRNCAAHTLIFRPPGEQHSEKFQGGLSACFSIDVAKDGFAASDRLLPKDSIHFQSPVLFRIARLLDRELWFEDSLSNCGIDFLLAELVGEVARFKFRDQLLPRWLRLAIDYLQSEFLRPLNLSSLAIQLGVHPVHLARVFRNAYGCTMAEFIRAMRIQHAMKELRNTEKSLTELAFECGFADQSHFTRCFKCVTGTTPAQYRSAHWQTLSGF